MIIIIFNILFALLLTDYTDYTVEALSTGITGEECIRQLILTLEEFPKWKEPGSLYALSCEYDMDQGDNS